MGLLKVERYSQEDKLEWNKFLDKTRNGIFLFNRDFMDYHADRFQDHSLLFYDDKEIIGIFPANQKDKLIVSHQGLTFGGLLYDLETKAIQIGEMVNLSLDYYRAQGFQEIILKPTPSFLHSYASEEALYFWHLAGSQLYRRDLSSLLDLSLEYKYSKGRKWIINKARKEGVTISLSSDWETFHRTLSDALKAHGTHPVHTVDELKLLHSRFPDKIKLYSAKLNDEFIAGALTFSYGKTLHTQYLANSEKGREVGGLDLLLDELVTITRQEGFKFLSFGISTTEEGRKLNSGLLQQKESYGGRGVLHDWYKLSLK